MRNVNKLIGTGCFVLCVGGFVGDGQFLRAESNAPDAKTALTNAVASAASASPAPAPTIPVDATTASAEAAGGYTPAPTTAPAAPTPKPPEAPNLNSAVVNVGVDGMVHQFSAQDMELSSALRFLSIEAKRNIVASKEVTAANTRITVSLYDVTFKEALDALLRPNGFDYIERGNFIYVYTEKELEDIKKRDHKTANRIFRLHYITAKDAAVLIKPLLSSFGVVAITPDSVTGLPTGTTDTGGMAYTTDDTLVINDYPENLAEVAKGLKDLDVRPKQVLVEATILNTTLSDDNALGVDITSLSGLDFPTLISALGTAASSSTTGGTTTTSGSTTNIVTPANVPGQVLANGSTQTNIGTGGFSAAVPPGGLSIGFLNNHVSAFVRALESVTNTSVVANPKVLSLNKQHGEVLIGQRLGYLTTSTSQTTTDQTVQFIDVGTKLVFRPFIGDNGYIRMEIHPEDSSGSIDSKGIPQMATTEVTSNIMVKDGRTVVIGGLFREAVTSSRGQVPVLGNIPILGTAFRQTSDSTQRSETIVLITPHVINDDTALYDQSEKEAEDVHRLMLGNRAGLQPWSRDRIAELWYSKAQEQLDKNCPDKAIMYTDWALNTNPQFIEAIKLREKLTNKKMEEASQSAIQPFVRDILGDDAPAIPDSGGAAHYPAPSSDSLTLPPATMPAATAPEGR